MNFNELKEGIQKLSDSFRQNAALAVNTHLTVRNWLTGFYIVKFEQNGEDRAKYGAKFLQNLADGYSEDGLSYRNLRLYRQFYLTYPHVSIYIPKFIQKYFGEIWQSPIAKLQIPEIQKSQIGQSVIAKSGISTKTQQTLPVDKLLSKLSFTHFTFPHRKSPKTPFL